MVLNKDIVVKNSVKKFTYMDYDTAKLFYETNLLLELPEEIYMKIMQSYFQSNVIQIPRFFKPQVSMYNGALINHNWNNKRDYIRSRMDLYDTDYEKFFKCLCYTKKGTKCKCNTNGELNYIQNNLNEIVMSGYKKFNKGFMEHNELYTIKYLVGELSYYKADRHRNVLYGLPRDKDYRQQAYISRLCKRHEPTNIIEYAKQNGYEIRNGYVIRTKAKGEY